MANIDLTRNGWCDLIFQGRNKAYGAYKLRVNTGKRNLKAIITIAILAAAAIIIFWAKTRYDEYQLAHQANQQVTELSALDQPKKKAEVKRKEIVQEKKEVVKEVKSSIKFTAPVIKKDNEVKPEEEMKTQDQLMQTKTAIGALDVKGNSDNGVVMQVTQRVADEPVQAEAPKPEVENKVFDVVEQMPSFPGGSSALMQYLANNIKYPVVAQENGVQGRVVVSFVVEKDGSISDVKVVRSVDPSLDREAQRVVRSMPRWIPGKQNGSAVRVKYNVPVSFRLQ